jgi:hypothetical protein
MPTFEEHCRETAEKTFSRFEDVHKWLDEFQPTLGPEHRKMRHNPKGVLEVLKKWGEEAAHAAQIHIDQDENSHIKQGALWVPKNKEKYE